MDRSRSLLLTLLEDRITPSSFMEIESNNTFATANLVTIATGDILTTAPDDWLNINAALGLNTDTDYFQFTVDQKSGVFFDIDSRDTGLSATLDTVITVFNANQSAFANGSNDDGYDFDDYVSPRNFGNSGFSFDSSLYLDMPAGTYFVRVTSFASGSSGDYQLRLLADSGYSSTVPEFANRPGASDTLYLDFDGHAATDAWGTYNALPFDFSGNGSQFTPGERLAIRNVFDGVADDYAPFNINVTTVNPGSFTDGNSFRMIITESDSTIVLPDSGVLGVAFLSSYASGGSSNQEAFTFARNFGYVGSSVSARIVAGSLEMGNTTAHEFGHALGLRHFDSGVLPFGIMATPDNGLNLEHWEIGTNDLGNFQDDMAIIANNFNTIGYRNDDHADTPTFATTLIGPGNTLTGSGVIERPTSDIDYFQFVGSGDTTVSINVSDYSGNANVELRLFDALGNLVAMDDPSNTFNAKVNVVNLPGGVYFVEVRSNGGPGEAGAYTVSVNTTVNQPPVLDPIGDKTVRVLDELRFTATASDPDIPPQNLTFSLMNAPTGASIDPVTGVFTWTPTLDQAPGQYTFTVVVTDDNLLQPRSDSEQIIVTVNELNQRPVILPIGNRDIPETKETRFQVIVSDGDTPAQNLTYSLINAPTGASIDPTTGVFTWTPTEAQGPGSFTFTFMVTDDGEPEPRSATEEVTFTIIEVNQAPVINPIGTKSIDELSTLTFTVTASDPDAPAQNLTYSLLGSSIGASIDPTTGVFTWTPTEAQGPSRITFTVAVRDDGPNALSATQQFQVIVNEMNQAPIITPIQNRTLVEGTTLNVNLSASDADRPTQSFTFSLVSGPSGVSINPLTGVLSWTATGETANVPFVVRVTDDGSPGLSSDTAFNVTVSNAPPRITSLNVSPTAQTGQLVPLVVDFFDPGSLDAHTVTIDWGDGTVPDQISVPASMSFTGAGHTFATPGTFVVNVVVTDDDGAAVVQQRTVIITPAFVLPTVPPNPTPPPVPPVPPVVVPPGQGGLRQTTSTPYAVGAGAGGSSNVLLFDGSGNSLLTIEAFPGFTGGVRVAVADVTGDGIADLITGTGPGIANQVNIFDGKTQKLIQTISPFEASFTGGVFVSAGDIDGDGKADIAISPDNGGGPRVRLYHGGDFMPIADGLGIDDPNFRGGARTSIADINGDGKADLLVAAGLGGGPRIALFDGTKITDGAYDRNDRLVNDFFLFEQSLRNGAFVALGDVSGDGKADLIGGGGPGGAPRVRVFDGATLLRGDFDTTDPGLTPGVQIANFFAGDTTDRGGVRIVAKNLDGDGKADLVLGAGDNAGSRLTRYLGSSLTLNGTPTVAGSIEVFPGFGNGIFVG